MAALLSISVAFALTLSAGGANASTSTFSGNESIPGGFTVPANETWDFDPGVDTTVEVDANVVVEGVLEMRPNPGVTHTLRFVDVDEGDFVGGGLDPVATDVGLWIVEDGVLDAVGEEKAGWNRTGSDVTWDIADELVQTPDLAAHTLDEEPDQYHEAVPPYEVVNLTRSVRIEGTPGGRSHVFIRSSQAQTIKYVSIRHMGPTPPVGENLGRYPLHFHMMDDDSEGSLVEGVVIRDSGAHAFVPHASHGVTFRDTVAVDITDSAYWWDPIKGGFPENATDDITYDHALACQLAPAANATGGGVVKAWGAFHLVAGEGGGVTDSVACGVNGPSDAAGFAWPPNDEQAWEFTGNVTHSNLTNGIWIWHNASTVDHFIEDFTAYDMRVGIDDGAYRNKYKFDDVTIVGTSIAALQLHALVGSASLASWDCWHVAETPTAVEVHTSNANPPRVHPVTMGLDEGDNVGTLIDRKDNNPTEDRIFLVAPGGGC